MAVSALAPEIRIKKSKATWNLGYTFDKTKIVDPTTQIAIVDKTSQVTGGFGWKDKGNWSVGAGVNYAVTPEENLSEVGPQLTAGYKYYFKSKKTKLKKGSPSTPTDEFRPDVGAKLTLARLGYTENFSASKARGRRKNSKPTTGKNQITQSLVKLNLTSDIRSWLSLGAYAATYGYSRNVSQFLTYLDSARSVAGQAGGLSTTISGLPKSEEGIDVDFYLSDDWVFTARYSRALLASDHSLSSTVRGELSDDLTEAWTVGVGAEYDHLVGFNETLGILSVGYTF